MLFIAFFIGIAILWLAFKLIKFSIKVFWKLLINALIGGVVLLIINIVGGLFGLIIPITFLSALIVGVLGIPGILILIVLAIL